MDEVVVHPVVLPHDRLGTNGFVIDAGGVRVGYATDLGHVPAQLFDRFRDLDVLAIELNYDVQMQLTSGRPWFLRYCIMGGAGHLSNDQCWRRSRKFWIIMKQRRRGCLRTSCCCIAAGIAIVPIWFVGCSREIDESHRG